MSSRSEDQRRWRGQARLGAGMVHGTERTVRSKLLERGTPSKSGNTSGGCACWQRQQQGGAPENPHRCTLALPPSARRDPCQFSLMVYGGLANFASWLTEVHLFKPSPPTPLTLTPRAEETRVRKGYMPKKGWAKRDTPGVGLGERIHPKANNKRNALARHRPHARTKEMMMHGEHCATAQARKARTCRRGHTTPFDLLPPPHHHWRAGTAAAAPPPRRARDDSCRPPP